jgi:hypothetical protein
VDPRSAGTRDELMLRLAGSTEMSRAATDIPDRKTQMVKTVGGGSGGVGASVGWGDGSVLWGYSIPPTKSEKEANRSNMNPAGAPAQKCLRMAQKCLRNDNALPWTHGPTSRRLSQQEWPTSDARPRRPAADPTKPRHSYRMTEGFDSRWPEPTVAGARAGVPLPRPKRLLTRVRLFGGTFNGTLRSAVECLALRRRLAGGGDEPFRPDQVKAWRRRPSPMAYCNLYAASSGRFGREGAVNILYSQPLCHEPQDQHHNSITPQQLKGCQVAVHIEPGGCMSIA